MSHNPGAEDPAKTLERLAAEQAAWHRERGATLETALYWLKTLRQGCRERVESGAGQGGDRGYSRDRLERDFDQMEVALCRAWSRPAPSRDGVQVRRHLELLKALSDRVRAGLPAAQVIAFAVSELAGCLTGRRVAYARLGKGGRLQVLQCHTAPGLADLSGREVDLATRPRYLTELRNCMPVLSENVAVDPLYGDLGTWLAEGGAHATLDLPVRSGGELVGLLCVAAPQPRSWAPGLVRLLTQVGDILNGVCEQEAQGRAEQALREASVWLRGMFQALEEAVFLLTPERELVDCNPAAERMFQYSRREMGYIPLEMLHLDRNHYLEFGTRIDGAFEKGESATFQFRFKRKDGEVFPTEQTVALLRNDGGAAVGILAVVRDITERKRLEEELHALATTDPLTGALNRRRFLHRADEEFQAARRYGRALAFFMLDVDHFKSINDEHGHPQGDEVLRRLSRFCDGALRQTDLFGRLGGEEFAVLLPETELETAIQVVERLRVGLAQLEVPLAGGGTLHFSISGGLAHLQPADADLQALLQRADEALYRAKGEGRNRVVIG